MEPRYRYTTILEGRVRAQSCATLTFRGQKHVLPPDRLFNIGSHEDNDLSIEDEFISSFHARLVCREGGWVLSDLHSTNGTRVNGLKVREAELPNAAAIQFGRVNLEFAVEAAAAVPLGDVAFAGMIARSPPMLRLFALVRRIADAPAPVLITGDSGSGKELVARALHDTSSRANGPYIALNCGALAATMIEAELFGHVKGAFTGALADKKGAFEAAGGGTLFLDEIGELPLELQPKLLRVLETSTIRKIGGMAEIPVDTRIVAATHRNLPGLVEAGRFREDLFHRLYVLTATLPPLAERPEDILPLAQHFLSGHCLSGPRLAGQSGGVVTLTDEAEAALMAYAWPGNVRELRNVILRALLLTDGGIIGVQDLVFSGEAFRPPGEAQRRVRKQELEDREHICEVLERTCGNRAEAARLLGLSKSTFHDRLKRLGIGLKTTTAAR